MILMSVVVKQILSFILVIVFGLLIYFLIILLRKNNKKLKSGKMLSLNQVIKFKTFVKFLEFKKEEKEPYTLVMMSINNFNVLKNVHSPKVIHNYIRHVVKNISIELPYGSKLSQTTQRDTFIIYIPGTNIGFDYANIFKEATLIPYTIEDIKIETNINVSYFDSSQETTFSDLISLQMALVTSKRNLTRITEFNSKVTTSLEEYRSIRDIAYNEMIKLKLYDYKNIKNNISIGKYLDANLKNNELINYFNSIPSKDLSWINMMIVEYLLNSFKKEFINSEIVIPISLKTLENDEFYNYFLIILNKYNLNAEDVYINLLDYKEVDQVKIIKHILELTSIGIKFAMQVSEVNHELYQTIRSNHIKRLILTKELLNFDISELMYFSKVHHLELLVLSEALEVESSLNSFKMNLINEKILNDNTNKKKRGDK